MIRVVVAEDQSLVLAALSALIGGEAGITVVGQARDGASALALVLQTKPDVLVTDIEMPTLTGLDVATEIARQRLSTRVVIVTTFARSGYLRRALDANVRGYVLKDAPAEELAHTIRCVHTGGRVIAPELAQDAWSEADPLTDRERQVLRRAGDGETASRIASELALSDGTVRNYLSSAIAKVGGTNRIEAARIAREKGWL
jgi:two-component system, NarL family, response regulator DesR